MVLLRLRNLICKYKLFCSQKIVNLPSFLDRSCRGSFRLPQPEYDCFTVLNASKENGILSFNFGHWWRESNPGSVYIRVAKSSHTSDHGARRGFELRHDAGSFARSEFRPQSRMHRAEQKWGLPKARRTKRPRDLCPHAAVGQRRPGKLRLNPFPVSWKSVSGFSRIKPWYKQDKNQMCAEDNSKNQLYERKDKKNNSTCYTWASKTCIIKDEKKTEKLSNVGLFVKCFAVSSRKIPLIVYFY